MHCHGTPVWRRALCLSQEKDAHAATQAQFRSLYRDKYAPLKAWRADHEGEVRAPSTLTLHPDPTSSLACLHKPSTQCMPGTRQSWTEAHRAHDQQGCKHSFCVKH